MRLVAVLVLCLCIVLAGCQVDSSKEKHLMSLRSGRDVDTRKAHYDGEYRLYRIPDATPRPSAEPVASLRLARGEWIGFRSDQRAARVAIVGKQEFALEAGGRYVWRVQPDPGQMDAESTAAIMLGVAIAGGIVAGVAIALTPF